MSRYYLDLPGLTELANDFYIPSRFAHAARVASYTLNDALTRKDVRVEEAYATALAHDLVTSTDCRPQDLSLVMDDALINIVMILSKADDESYKDYAERINAINDPLITLIARADLKDNITQDEDLVNEYKDCIKYFL